MNQKEKSTEVQAQTQEILSAISSEIPLMIKNILLMVFSEDSGKTLGKAAAAYYKELKQGGLPEEVAIRLTEDYMRAFTSLADLALPEKLRSLKKPRAIKAKHALLKKLSSTQTKKKPTAIIDE